MPLSGNEIRINAIDGAAMVYIDAGPFVMGSSDAQIDTILRGHPDWSPDWFAQEKPQRTVVLPGFWIYRDPVTVAAFRACCEAIGWSMPAPPEWGWQDDHPMVNVSWQDVQRYAEWAGAAIPTEAQWEKAARGVDGRIWPWGNDWDPACCRAPGDVAATLPIGSHPANVSPCGARDMAGNVWEWCLASPPGEYDRAPLRAPGRRAPNASGHVLRGGSWQSAFTAYLRCAYRCFDCDIHRGRGLYRRPGVGFRCVVAEE